MARVLTNDKNNKNWKSKARDYIPVVLIASLTFLPLTTMGNLLRFGIVGVLFFFNDRTGVKFDMRMISMFLTMISGIVLSYLAVCLVEQYANFSVMLHEAMRFGFYILLIIVVYGYKIQFKFIYWICIFILLFNLTIQILQFNDVQWVYDFIRDNYVTNGTSHLDLATTEYGTESFRSGSIYLNPNVYMVIPCTTLCVILQANILKHNVMNYVWAVATLFSLLLTGSRTTFFVATALVVYYFITDKKLGNARFVVFGILVLLLVFNYNTLVSNYRVFDLDLSSGGSFGVKIGGLFAYLKNANPLYFITGSLSSSLVVQIDAEWGYVFSYFGILGLYWYINFLILLYNRNKKALPFLTKTVTIVIMLIAMTASVVLCMPVFSFFCLIGLVEIEVSTKEPEHLVSSKQ